MSYLCRVRRFVGIVLLFLALDTGVAVAQGSFEVATVKPAKPDAQGWSWDEHQNLTTMANMPLMELVRSAYGLKTLSQVVGVPDWGREARYDITGKVDIEEFKKIKGLDELAAERESETLLQSLLAERFGVRASRETRKMPSYALTVDAKGPVQGGLKLAGADEKGRHADVSDGRMSASNVTMDDLSEILSGKFEVGQRVVVNQTGLNGKYDLKLEYAPDNGQGVAPDAIKPGLLEALREQLGLRLVKSESDVPVVVVQEIKRPEFD